MTKTIIGIDISKLTVDVCVQQATEPAAIYSTIKNNPKDLREFFKPFKDHEVLLGMEDTGCYNNFLYEVLPEFSFSVYVINPLHIKKSLGLVRGKNDKVDSLRIALFLAKNYMDLRVWKPTTENVRKIKLLNAKRRERIKMKTVLLTRLSDKAFIKSFDSKELIRMDKALVKTLDKQIAAIETQVSELIQEDEELKEKYENIQTIPGVGKVLAMNILIKTNGFTEIGSARKMACYSGVAPFEYSSGTSVRYRTRVSSMADKELKTLLHLGALRNIQLKNDLSVYYHRKVAEGKNKMLVLNAVRNKIIHRIYAILKSGEKYQNNLAMS